MANIALLSRPGCIFKSQPVILKKIEEKGGSLKLLLSDSSGEIAATMGLSQPVVSALHSNLGKAIAVSGPVLMKEGAGEIVGELHVRSFEPCKDYKAQELFAGISDDAAVRYVDDIKKIVSSITHDGYRRLLDCLITDELLSKLSMLPASLDYNGTYRGGALASMCVVACMARTVGSAYANRPNGITTSIPDWNLLLTAALLLQAGRAEFLDEENAYRKSRYGVMRNYYSVLQTRVEKSIWENSLDVSQEDLSMLLNVLNVALIERSGTLPVCNEGLILRDIYRLYSNLDYCDYLQKNLEYKEGEEYLYDVRHDVRYFVKESEVAGCET